MSSWEATWFKRAFDASYVEVYRHRTDEAAASEVQWLAERVALRPGHRVLDLGCGNGRHVEALALRGARLVGLDYSLDLLRRAAARRAPGARFVRGDMRVLPLRTRFDVILSLFTSFGYFLDDRENEAVLVSVAERLLPRGRFLIDYLNAPCVRRTLAPSSIEERDGLTIRQERSLSTDGRRVVKRVEVCAADGRRETYGESVRLFDRSDMERMLEAAGLHVKEVWGGLLGQPFDDTAGRLVLLAVAGS